MKLRPWSAGLRVSHEAVAGHEAVRVDSRVTMVEAGKRHTCHKCHQWPIPYMTDTVLMEGVWSVSCGSVYVSVELSYVSQQKHTLYIHVFGP